MNNQLSHYISIEPDFFQELEGEFGVKITGKLVNFLMGYATFELDADEVDLEQRPG